MLGKVLYDNSMKIARLGYDILCSADRSSITEAASGAFDGAAMNR